MTDADVGREAFRAEWLLSFLAADLSGDMDPGPDALYEFHIGDSTACLQVRGGRMRVVPGPAATPPDVTVRAAAPQAESEDARRQTRPASVYHYEWHYEYNSWCVPPNTSTVTYIVPVGNYKI